MTTNRSAMMRRRLALLAGLVLFAAPASSYAQSAAPMTATPAPAPTAAPAPNPAEATFLTKIMQDLPQRFATADAATAAGYVRYTNEDRTGAISYVNTQYWDTTDPDHPAQLWYDVNGKLLGADFSVPYGAGTPPSRFGIDASRWHRIGAHVHYVLMNPNGSYTYGKAVAATRYGTANNGDYSHPTEAGLRATGVVPAAAAVPAVFLYPSIYDVSVWVVPNPLGQFADSNPNVIPSPRAGRGEDDPM